MAIWTTSSMPDLVDAQDYDNASYLNALRDLALTHCGYTYLPTTAPTGFGGTLVAAYQFDGTASALLDRTGNGHDLSVSTGSEIYQQSSGLVGFAFDGATALVSAVNGALQITGELTLEIVAKLNRITATNDQCLIGHGDKDSETLATNWLYFIYAANATNQIWVGHEYGSGSDSDMVCDHTFDVGPPHYIAFTQNSAGTTGNVYRGETLVKSGALTAAAGGTTGHIYIGGVPDASAAKRAYLHGVVYSARIWSSQMNAAQVALAYAQARQIATVS